MNELELIEKKIQKNRTALLAREEAIRKEPDLFRRCELAYEAATYASRHTADVYSSPTIEKPFLELAELYPAELSAEYVPGTVLHVMTEAYRTGGHTRCVERWIARCPEHRHACVLLGQTAPLPERLCEQIKKSGGTLECYDVEASMLQRALKLRQYASGFEYVVLYTHMNDPIALIAFGTRAFRRPVIFFNHADHAFWLGVSIADCVADWNSFGRAISVEKRGVSKSVHVGLPQEDKPAMALDEVGSRRQLGIAEGRKVIFSSGLASKYEPLGRPSFEDFVTDLVGQDPNILFYVAGPRATSRNFWGRLRKAFPDNLILTGYLNYATEYPLYLAAADLVIDSYPVCGGTALCDAILAGKPVVSLSHDYHSDYVLESMACCRSYEEFLDKVRRILSDADFAQRVSADVQERLLRETNHEAWHQRCMDILSSLTEGHRIYDFERQPLGYATTVVALKTFRWMERATRFSLFKKVWRRLFFMKFGRYEKKLILFGIPFINERHFVCDEAEVSSAPRCA